ncbi:MAG: FeoB-associated Cys-rich membrane protein [Armatimonadetes bacterium]|nr:FeoB-associated Cys-rich membrane protein [Akkermansiaceae bacterium]
MNWQSPIALIIVAVTLVAFIYTIARPRKKSGCGSSCGCAKANPAQTSIRKRD